MSHIVPKNKLFISLDSTKPDLSHIEQSLDQQLTESINQVGLIQKTLHQIRINNVYLADVTDNIFDDSIFENDEID